MRRAKAAAVLSAAIAILTFFPPAGYSLDIIDVQNGALDQPRINAAVFPYATIPVDGQPLTDPDSLGFNWFTLEFTSGPSYNLEAYLDTGASGILISNSFKDVYVNPTPLPLQAGAVYQDVGVSGSDNFAVSQPIQVHLAHYVIGNPGVDAFNVSGGANTAAYTPIPAGAIQATVGPIKPIIVDETDNLISSFLGDFDIVGMPAMKGRVVVMDARKVNNFEQLLNFDVFSGDAIPDVFMRTYLYNKATAPAFNAANEYDPGIPTTSHHVNLTYASFNRFTQTTGGTAPTLSENPIIGLDPNLYTVMRDNDHPAGAKGGIRITRTYDVKDGGGNVIQTINGVAEGNFLLDTGAAASIISKRMALSMGVSYSASTEPNPADPTGAEIPFLIDVNGDRIANQFRLTLNGVGGTSTLAGFYLDDLMLRTMEGGLDDLSNEQLHFLNAPVLVGDITIKDPTKADGDPTQLLTLDGIFGMNFLVASGLIDSADAGDGLPSALAYGAFDWMTIDFADASNGILGLNYAPYNPDAAIPEPASLGLLAIGGTGLLLRRKRH